jgi:hypothetical protein
MVISWWSLGLGWLAVAGRCGLGLELGAQLPGLAFGAAGGPRQRERAPGRVLRLGGRGLLAVPVGGEFGELVHGWPSPVPAAGLPLCSTVTGRSGRSPYVARTGRAQD